MILERIFNKNTGEKLTSVKGGDFEMVDPVKFYKEFLTISQMILNGVTEDELNGRVRFSEISKEVFKQSVNSTKEKIKEIKAINLPENLKRLIITQKKNEQENLIRGTSLTPDLLLALIFEAHDKHGFLYSEFRSEYPPKGIDLSQLPFAFEVNETEDKVKVYGKTSLSNGQLKQALKQRKVLIAKFIDKDDLWHCFFFTFKSLRGEEIWLGVNQPHYHYISSSFGISRDEVIRQLKSERYKLGNIPHIKLDR
jgi:hypothetical protein